MNVLLYLLGVYMRIRLFVIFTIAYAKCRYPHHVFTIRIRAVIIRYPYIK
jgi:hypothetical protein